MRNTVTGMLAEAQASQEAKSRPGAFSGALSAVLLPLTWAKAETKLADNSSCMLSNRDKHEEHYHRQIGRSTDKSRGHTWSRFILRFIAVLLLRPKNWTTIAQGACQQHLCSWLLGTDTGRRKLGGHTWTRCVLRFISYTVTQAAKLGKCCLSPIA